MRNILNTVKNIWNIEELRSKISLTLIFLSVYRFGAHVPLPGIDLSGISKLSESANAGSKGLVQILSSFTGGAFNNASVLALGIMPYISASIVVQLMGLTLPFFQKMQKDGESGRRQINRITRWLTVAICFLQAPAYLTYLTTRIIPFSSAPGAYLIDISNNEIKFLFWMVSLIVLTSGTLFTMWIGEKITGKGIGNGVSLVIMVGIIAKFPQAVASEIASRLEITKGGLIFLFFEGLLWLLIILFSICIIQAVRKIPVQYVRRIQGGVQVSHLYSSANSIRQYIPLKVISAGVMPIIFAQAIMSLPLILLGSLENEKINYFLNILQSVYGFWYNFILAVLIILFTFFYTAISIPVNQIADDLKRNGGHIFGAKPGKDTAKFLDEILSKITLPGAFLLALIAIIPAFAAQIGISESLALFYGGTSILIVVGVVLDTMQQIDAYLLNHHYSGFVEK